MNLVDLHRNLSTVRKMCIKYSFSVKPTPGIYGGYSIQFKWHDRWQFVSDTFMKVMMYHAMHYKAEQMRKILKIDYQIRVIDFENVLVFESERKAKKAMHNLLLWLHRKHGNYLDRLFSRIEIPF